MGEGSFHRGREYGPGESRDEDTRPPARLVVWVAHADRRDRFLVEHWTLLRETPHGAVEFREHGQPDTLRSEEIELYVCELINALDRDRRMGFHSGVRVAWGLPLPLIRELRAELWQQAIAPSDAVGDQRMGARAQVVYRLAEFIGRRDGWAGVEEACERKWGRLSRIGSGALLDAHSVNGHPDPHGAKQGLCLIDDNDLAIYATSSCSNENWFRDVSSAVTAGVPVVMWRSDHYGHRITDSLGTVRADAKNMVLLARIRNLPVLLHHFLMSGIYL
ncbi:hypothetical protein DFP74_2713 [Nocardiopsis sp. Huas11]|uniref:hypothetical protein n=1 Tax=Nocardiopsis sp. Huas11 TaxID=2183912 RepID=UPI000EAD7C60|nr:hypothetical protein [Nocardiopsis sp. Huas11]RKS07058.1 hypothetical protein DFP74_2713 [Nocardiopsis sp. Huas11]